MCTTCKTKRIYYVEVYNSAFNSKDRNAWIQSLMNTADGSCIRCKKNTLMHAYKAVTSQTIFQNVPASTKKKLLKQHEIACKQAIIRLKKIQKNTLHFLYKPQSVMFKKSCKELDIE